MTIITALHEAERRITALDFTADHTRIEEITQQLAQTETALATGQARREELLHLLRPLRSPSAGLAFDPIHDDDSGSSVADALLAGSDPSEAAATRVSRAELEHERDALRDGIAELARRRDALVRERKELQSASGMRALDELKPLCAALENQAREAAKLILHSFTALTAIGRATNSNPPGLNKTAEAVASLHGPGALLVTGEAVEVPSEIVALIGILASKSPAYANGVPRTVQLHDRHAGAGLVSARRGPEGPRQRERIGL